MKRNTIIGSAGFAMLILLMMGTSALNAGGKAKFGPHPAYLHALSDLRAARWMVDHRPGNRKATQDEMMAVQEIDKTIAELKRAAIDDGKDINFRPPVQEKPDHGGCLHDAIDLLRRARKDVEAEEDHRFAQDLNPRIFGHIDAAIASVDKAIHALKY